MVNVIWTTRLQDAFMDYVRLAQDSDHTSSFSDSDIFAQVKQALQQSEATSSRQPAENQDDELGAGVEKPTQPLPASVSLDLIRKVSAALLAFEKKTKDADSNHSSPIESAPSKYWIHTLLKGSGVHVPPPPVKEKNPELERILNQARAQIAEKDYDRMMDGITRPPETVSGSLREQVKEFKELKSTLIGIVNVLYTGIAVFVAVYMLSKHFVEDVGMRFLLGFLGFIMIVASESYLYYRHVTTTSGDSRASSRKKKKSPTNDSTLTSSASYDAIKNALHDEVMKAATATSSSPASTTVADEKTTLSEPFSGSTITTAVKTSTTSTIKRRPKKA